MKYTARIRRVADGVTRTVDPLKWGEGAAEWSEGVEFWWRDGNFSCDCNRHLEFLRAANEEEVEVVCSDGKFRVEIVLEDGTIPYSEFEEGVK